MRIDPNIKDGIYDNTWTMSREKWSNGRFCGGMTACLVSEWYELGKPLEEWGHYPDVPRVK